jgi:hypothetical protein
MARLAFQSSSLAVDNVIAPTNSGEYARLQLDFN